MSVFVDERDKALNEGKCMACGMKLLAARRQRVVCGKLACAQYYHALYDTQEHVMEARRVYQRGYRKRRKR